MDVLLEDMYLHSLCIQNLVRKLSKMSARSPKKAVLNQAFNTFLTCPKFIVSMVNS